MKKVPKIGIVGWSTGPNSFGSTISYLYYLSQFGEVRILTPKKTIDQDLDLVILPGGKDMPPDHYGEIPGYYNSDADQFKETFYKWNLPQYIDAGIPIFGICLGFQQLCVYFGAKLEQDISWTGHETSKSDERGESVNKITFKPEYIKLELEIYKKLNKKELKVCSLHHQGVIDNDEFPESLSIIGFAKETKSNTNIVEFIKHKKLPIAGCQNHP